MAMLRITSSKVVPYAVRAISSDRILSVSITNASITNAFITNASITNAFNGCDQVSSPICHHFSTDAKKQSDRKLSKFLKSEIKSKETFLERKMPAIPSDFPFTINDDPTDGGDVNLTRDFHGEKINVVVEKPFYMDDVDDADSDDDSDVNSTDSDDDSNTGDDGDVSSDSDSDDSDASSDEERKVEVEKKDESKPIELKVTVSKQNGKISEFEVSASADEIMVNSVLIKEPAPESTESSDPLLSFGPYPVEEEGELQIALREYLKIRGIEKSNHGFLYKYMLEKSRKHPVVALKMLRNFIKE